MGYKSWKDLITLIRIALGNSKLGDVPTLSLPPILSCVPGCLCSRDCYALKAWKQYKGTREAWADNLKAWYTSPERFTAAVHRFLAAKSPRFFRWHASGDCPDPQYFEMVKETARAFPGTRFLIFTKRYASSGYDWSQIPVNLTVVWSAWPGMDIPDARPMNVHVAWMSPRDGGEHRIPGDALECPGSCVNCAMCWSLPELGRDVFFRQH